MNNYLNAECHNYKQMTFQKLVTRITHPNQLQQQLVFKIFFIFSLLFPVSELIAQGSIPCDGSLYFTLQLASSTRISSVKVNAAGRVTVADKVTLNPNILTNATVYYVFQSKTLTEKGIDLSNLANGVYSVQVRKIKGATLIKKLLINR